MRIAGAPMLYDNRCNMNSQLYLERRRSLRMDVDLPVRLAMADDRRTVGRLRNASISGALIECSIELPTYAWLRVEILADGHHVTEPIYLSARVIRAERPCLGVEWRERAPVALVELLKRASGDGGSAA